MTNFLFWNFNPKRQIQYPESILARTALLHSVDLIMLAECKLSSHVILEELNQAGPSYCYRESPNRRFRVFARFPGEFLERFAETQRMCVWRLRLPARKEILVAIIHFFDRRNHSEYDQHSLSGELARFLRDAEMVAGHGRTVLVGDFNMNPFDKGMIDAKGFGAMMTRALTRNLKGDGQDPVLRFYNPMWGRFGDSTVGPPGTFYHRQNAPTNISWHMLDQVLIRPDLIRAFREDSLSILTRVPTGDGEIDLIRENRKHWSLAVSDHLPILFQMNLSEDLPHE